MTGQESRPAGDRAAREAPAAGLEPILEPGSVLERCADWATSSTVSRLVEDQLAAGLPVDPADLDRIVFGECEDDR